MTKREFAAIGRDLAQGADGLQVCQEVLVLGQPQDVLVGYVFDQTRSKHLFKLYAVCIPLIVPHEVLGWVIGWPLWNRDQRTYAWSAADLGLLKAVVSENNAKLRELGTPEGVANYGESQVERSGSFEFEIASCRARRGEFESARVALERVKDRCDPSIPFHLQLRKQAAELEAAMAVGEASTLLDHWREISRNNIGRGIFV